ncbi:MAG: Peptidoglycan D,D-transpeptidase FtsI [Chlamydiia bacterium]|nr:Peptidoglycan D,D-transpeptidase FtsI [Chlamydiia bacterium]MCH9615035.1 Peptidoglycan D,D-transpeptidase FtsI [Chlamydiia bacterium]MCH9629914.1 Peptidoglycan D,D-transpeptidase FtsI [Chlamydiia bacterium]
MNRADGRRLIVITLGLFALFGALIVRFYQIQIVQGEKWRKHAKNQHQFVVEVPAKRGVFYSNCSVKEGHVENPTPFVVDIPKFHLFADSRAIPKELKYKVSREIYKRLPVDGLFDEISKNSRSRRLAKHIELEDKETLLEWWLPFAKKHKLPRNALYFIQDYKRSYPFGHLLGPVLHTVREDRYPTGGLELQFNQLLQGKAGKKRLLRSPRNPLDIGEVIEQHEDGADVYLTINHYLQAIAEEEIEKGVKAVHAKKGWAIIMDPSNGEILALAQYPFFEPSNYRSYYNDPKLLDLTKLHALNDVFEPGSPVKALSAALALTANEELEAKGMRPLFHPDQMIRTDNGLLPGRTRPMKDVRTHKYLNMDLATQKSSCIYFARLIQKVIETMGVEWYRDKLTAVYGFGEKTGIELPGESRGLLPTPGKIHPNGQLEWSTPTPYSLAIGYNLLTNGFQVVRSFGILANGGKRVEPTLVKKIVKGETLVYEHKPDLKRVLSEDATTRVIKAMRFAAYRGGSAARAKVPGYTIAGKTGTSEKIVGGVYSKINHFSSFVGFAPCNKPRLVLMIGIDEPEYKFIPGYGMTHYGGKCAAPVFREIMKRSLEYLGVSPDDTNGGSHGATHSNRSRDEWNKELKALKELYAKWNM